MNKNRNNQNMENHLKNNKSGQLLDKMEIVGNF